MNDLYPRGHVGLYFVMAPIQNVQGLPKSTTYRHNLEMAAPCSREPGGCGRGPGRPELVVKDWPGMQPSQRQEWDRNQEFMGKSKAVVVHETWFGWFNSKKKPMKPWCPRKSRILNCPKLSEPEHSDFNLSSLVQGGLVCRQNRLCLIDFLSFHHQSSVFSAD